MASPNRINSDTIFTEDVSFAGTVSAIPAGTITNAMVSASADITHTKVEHRFPINYSQSNAGVVAAATQLVYTAYFTGSVVDARAVCSTAPTGGDLAFTVDIKKSTAGGAFATILTAVETFNSSSTDRAVQDMSLDSTKTTLAADDTLEVIVAVSGSTGTQGTGLVVTITVAENSNA